MNMASKTKQTDICLGLQHSIIVINIIIVIKYLKLDLYRNKADSHCWHLDLATVVCHFQGPWNKIKYCVLEFSFNLINNLHDILPFKCLGLVRF